MKIKKVFSFLLPLSSFLLASCSSTSAIPDGDQLFTGLKSTKYENYQESQHFTDTQEELEAVLATTPNGSIFGSSSLKSPLTFGLWIWNACSQSKSGLGQWFSKTFGSKPVLLSYANPELHVSVAEGTLKKRGYFNGHVTYEQLPQSNPKKAKLQYTVDMGPVWPIHSIDYVGFNAEADSLIRQDSLNACIRPGDPFDVADMEDERQRLSDLFRDNGYYYYQKDDAAYLADTVNTPGQVALRLQLADSLSERTQHPWSIGHVTLTMKKTLFEQPTDSMVYPNYSFYYSGKRPPMRIGALLSSIQLQHGKLYSAQKHDLSKTRLNSTGLFSATNFTFTPRNDRDDCDTLDLQIDCTFDKPYDFYVEAYAKGKTSGKFGPQMSVGLTKRNAFRGGELLDIKLTGSYEWQTGHKGEGTSSGFNSYQYGAEASIEMPRIFNPFRTPARKRFARMQAQVAAAKARLAAARAAGDTTLTMRDLLPEPRKRRPRFYSTPKTILKASASVINRANYYKRHVVSGELTYSWNSSEQSSYSFTPLNLTYEYMSSTTERFDSLLDNIPYLYQTMEDRFIPKMSFTYTYTSPSTYRNPITWWTTVSEAGNLVNLGYTCFGRKWNEKEKTMFKNPFSQFLKLETNFTKHWSLSDKSSVVAHLNAGVIWSLGNSTIPPYSEEFYVGGANSIRAFNARSIGPGRFRSTSRTLSYVEQIGDLKFQANLEYRPHLVGNLYGAVFLDAGNVWFLKNGYVDVEEQDNGVFHVQDLFKEMALGTGIGLRYDLGFFMLRVDWGIGLHVPYGDRSGFYNVSSFKDAQTLHLAIGLPF